MKDITSNINRITNVQLSANLAETSSLLAASTEEPEKDIRTKAFADKLKEIRSEKGKCTSDKLDDKIKKTPEEEAKESDASRFAKKLATFRSNKKSINRLDSFSKQISCVDPKTSKFINKHSCNEKFIRE